MNARLKKKVAVLGVIAVLIAVYVVATYWQPGVPGISSEDRRIVLVPPPKNTSEDRAAYRAVVERVAKEADTLLIGEQCVMEPLVLRLTEGALLAIKNTDATEHMIAFEDGTSFVLAPGYRKELNITDIFGKSAGIYRYSCDDLSKDENVGVLFVTR